MADLVTRIIADDKQFNDKIEQSKKTIKGWSDYNKKAGRSVDNFGGKMASLAAGSLAKMVGAVGAAAVSYRTLMSSIEATDKTGDMFATTMEQVKSSLDYMMTSIATADFSNFWAGMGESIRLAREYYAALDDLEDRRMGYGMRRADIDAAIQENRAVLNDPYSTGEEKNAALAALKEQEGKLVELTNIIRDKSRETADKMIANAANAAFSRADIERFKDYLAGTETGLHDLEAERKRLQSEYEKGKGAWIGGGGFGGSTYIEQTEASKAAEAALKSLEGKNKADIEFLDKINRLNVKERETWASLEQEYTGYSSQLSGVTRMINREARRRENEAGRENKIEIIPEGSLAELEKQISDARKMLMDATTTEGRASADALIKHLESQKAVVEVLFKYSDPGNIGSGNKFATADPLAPLKGAGTKLDMSNVVYSPELEMFDSWGERVGYVADQNRDLMDSIQGVSSIMANMGDVVGESAAQWTQWGANVLSAVGQGLPAIMALTTAKKAEATANTAAAASGAASSVASIPVVGPILAIASIASILGALANLPKFASGGIVPGTSFSGDKVLARVNSGEMILNQSQQKNLLGIANGAGTNITVGGEFKLRGSDLYALIEWQKYKKSWY